MTRTTLLAFWGAAIILGYLITFFFNASQAGTDASATMPDPEPAAVASDEPANAAAIGSRLDAGEVATKSETLSVDTEFPTGEDDTLATDTSAVGTVIPAETYPDSVLASTVSPSGPDTMLADRPAPDATGRAGDASVGADADPVTPAAIVAETTDLDPDVLRLIVLMWAVVMALPIVAGTVLSAQRAPEHLVLSGVWAVLIAAALLQNFWAIGASTMVQAFSFYPLWFFVAAFGFAVTALKLDPGAQKRLYAAAAGANLVFGIGLVLLPAISAYAFLVAALLQGAPLLLDPVVTARAKRAAGAA